MGTTFPCFMMEPTSRIRCGLRRFANFDSPDRACPSEYGYHNAQTPIEDMDARFTPEGYLDHIEWPKDDPRWPKTCQCGYVFRDDDPWQLFQNLIFKGPDGAEHTLRSAPPGAMWYATWLHYKGPDGKALVVMTPGGEWCIDGPSKDGPPGTWTRSGVPPQVTASPSIHIVGRYHGWLQNGQLVEC